MVGTHRLVDIVKDSAKKVSESPGRFKVVDLSSVDYVPTNPTRGIAFGTAGILIVTDLEGKETSFASEVLAAGIIHPMSVTRIVKTGTTAANIVAFW